MLKDCDTYAKHTGTPPQFNHQETSMTNDTTDAIAASRRRIDAGIAAVDRVLAERQSGLLTGIGSPDALLDALGEAAVAAAAADLAALSCAPPSTVIDGGELVAARTPNSP
jgi:hypothetical protein